MSNLTRAFRHPTSARDARLHASSQQAQPGDWIEVEGTRRAGPRRGEIVAVLGSPGHTHFRVRWDEQHESLLYPADGGCIVHAGRPRSRR